MKVWQGILLTVGIIMVVGGLIAVGLLKAIPQYAPGEATAMVERVIEKPISTYSGVEITETYLGRGIWEVRISSIETTLIFKVYETTDTVELCWPKR